MDIKKQLKIIGWELRKYRKDLNKTAMEVALDLEMGMNTISHIENGKNFQFDSFLKLCNYYQIDVVKLICDNYKK